MFVIQTDTERGPITSFAAKESDIPVVLKSVSEAAERPLHEIILCSSTAEFNVKETRYGSIDEWIPARELVQISCSLIPKERPEG